MSDEEIIEVRKYASFEKDQLIDTILIYKRENKMLWKSIEHERSMTLWQKFRRWINWGWGL